MICGHKRCNKRKCSYWKQFQTQKAVAPHGSLLRYRVLYKRGKKQGDFKFGLLVVDESMKEFRELQFDHDEVMEAVNVIEDHYPVKELINDFISYLDGDDSPPIKMRGELLN